jgi:class 3 adenylate cyclase
VFRDAIRERPNDGELLYWGALAHARAGASHAAHALLDQADALARPGLGADIASLRGRLWKDEYVRASQTPDALRCLERARDQYLAAYAVAGDPYPGINAASLSLLRGDHGTATRLARAIIDSIQAQAIEQRDCWIAATLAEAHLLVGDVASAASGYVDAHRRAAGNAGMVSTMRRQLALLARAVPEAGKLLELLPAADVVAFAGHMIDAVGRGAPRFPATLVPEVKTALNDALANLRDPVIYTSAACGADLLLIEAALERNAEINIVLPFDRDDFVRTSVAVGGDEWVSRFDAALSRANRIVMATEEGYLGDDALFTHAAMLVEGLAMLRAAQLQTAPRLLCLVDPVEDARVGGTRESIERWTRNVGMPHAIDLRKLRLNSTATGEQFSYARTAAASPATSPVDTAPRPSRALKTMLFADFAGYSRLHDAFAPLFQTRFLEIGARIIEHSAVKPLEAKTWGDAVYAVFESPAAGAEFALRFLERMLDTDWTAAGLPSTSQVRIALHAGPVFHAFDPVMGRDSHFGSSVTRAARIEPVTPPGMVYASEAFAATLAATGECGFALEYVGKLALAKGYGESRIYRLGRH